MSRRTIRHYRPLGSETTVCNRPGVFVASSTGPREVTCKKCLMWLQGRDLALKMPGGDA